MRLKAHKGSKATGTAVLAAVLAAGLAAGPIVGPARADDSLWGKALGAVGLSGDQNANATQSQQAPQKLPDVSVNAAPRPAPAPADNGNFFGKWFGGGSAPAPQTQPPVEPRRALEPSAAPQPVAAPAPAPEPSLWDKMLGTAGMSTQNPLNANDYSQRPKLTVPKERDLPTPAPAPDPGATRTVDSVDLTKPPGNYLDKVRGADGNVSGLRDSDTAKDKKFFGLF